MTEWILRRLSRRHDGDAPALHAAVGKLAGVTGILLNVLLFGGKLAAGLIAGSVSIVADALNNLSDAASSAVTYLGFRMAQRPADKHHPYGHARYEYLAGLLIAVLILLIGGELAMTSVKRILHPGQLVFSVAAVVIMACSIFLKLWMTLFYRKLGRRIHSTTLQAASADSRNDVLATSAVLLGSLIHRFWGVNVDGWIGLLVALFILWSGVGIARETISPLLGKQADRELLDGIEQLILNHRGVLGVHDLLVHDYGPGRYFASVHVELSAGEDPQACHEIIDDIECDALRELNVNLVIHYDPVCVDDDELNEMRRVLDWIICSIDPQLTMHDLRILRTSRRTKLVFDLEVPYSMKMSHDELKRRIDEALLSMRKGYRTVIRFDGKA